MAVPIYTPLEREMPERKKGYSKAAAFLGAVALVAVVVTIVAVQQGQTQSLAKEGFPTEVRFEDHSDDQLQRVHCCGQGWYSHHGRLHYWK